MGRLMAAANGIGYRNGGMIVTHHNRHLYHHQITSCSASASTSSGFLGLPLPLPNPNSPSTSLSHPLALKRPVFRAQFDAEPENAKTRTTTTTSSDSGKLKKRSDSSKDMEKGEERREDADSSISSSSKVSSVPQISLDDVNPVGLGRKSRQIFDEVWRKFSGLGQISRTPTAADDDGLLLIRGPMCEFSIPGAQDTTVLVVGATSRIGRIVIRKLMLRGYKVKALVRKADPEVIDMLPRSVTIAIGDVGDPSTLKSAVEGCNKIIYCATARSAITGDLNRVDNQGVQNVTKAFQDYNNELAQLRAGKSSKSKLLLAKFRSVQSLEGWEVRQGTYFQDVVAAKYDGGMDAKFEFTESGDAVFSGYVFTRGGYVELSKKLSLPLGSTLDRYDGLVLSVGGNGRSYVVILETGPLADTSQSKKYFARMTTKVGFCRVRVPFSSFRPVKPEDPPLDPFLVHTLTIRFEPRRQRPVEGPVENKQDPRSFKLIMEYIKALPTGQETDFILVSCTGSGIEPSRREQVLKAKKGGEDSLRRSGLGYTIVRPGPLQEEPGGQRALIFDQGNRISQGISCADVADICVKALHDSTARNKSFDVCYEYVAEQGNELYELVAHLPDKANNYLTPALSVLEKNT
ncbi:protein HIGH CHLOROPHYLL FLUORESCENCE PHENOTYPE 173, chloroplastic [Typha latifolia]|uniref:protein HIGH CHLOROPHYLL FLUORESCENCE PHENOTYPE 173, chloroplastic n=1 Tax=Typha latifolia TaxID=4733 RepID=UPI003C2EAC60